MASYPISAKSSSRWGSFLQQAVAGVESRLDTILADTDSLNEPSTTSKGSGSERSGSNERVASPQPPLTDADIRRSSSKTKMNDRLQERLAKAVVNRNSAKIGSISAFPATVPSRTDPPSDPATSPWTSINVSTDDTTAAMNGFALEHRAIQDSAPSNHIPGDSTDSVTVLNTSKETPISLQDASSRFSSYHSETNYMRHSSEVSHGISDSVSGPGIPNDMVPSRLTRYEEIIYQMQSEYESVELRRQEEAQNYLENIDALQAKLQYLTNEAIAFAKKAGYEAEAGSLEQKIAAKDEKIASLLEEGQKLSQNELKHMNIIRKLRSKSTEEEKRFNQLRQRAEDSEKEALQLKYERVKRMENVEMAELERTKALQRIEKELENVKIENEAHLATIKALHQRLVDEKTSNQANGMSNYKNLIDLEKRLVSDLRDELSDLKLEKELSDERHGSKLRNMQEETEREKEMSRRSVQELQSELGILESRLEVQRVRAEEASSGDLSEGQVKLLRQIEILQTQYSVATENWRGIEGSLLSRIANLEAERNEVTTKEVELRRKLREAGVKSRQLVEDLQKTNDEIQAMDHKLGEQNNELEVTRKNLNKAEEVIRATEQEFAHERETWEERLAEHVSKAKAQYQDYTGTTLYELRHQLSTESQASLNHPRPFVDKASPHERRYYGTPNLGIASTSESFQDRIMHRRPSRQPSQNSGFVTLPRHESIQTIPRHSISNGIPSTPSGPPDQQGDPFDEAVMPVTPERTINDMISVSTMAAGPSVQLVERMSASVRRLESEKASTRDELDRLSAMRDEAREQVVTLMREVEEKRTADEKLTCLQNEVTEINQRYQTTLEMLGEKSELVEELQADVADVKQMYRDLVESATR